MTFISTGVTRAKSYREKGISSVYPTLHRTPDIALFPKFLPEYKKLAGPCCGVADVYD